MNPAATASLLGAGTMGAAMGIRIRRSILAVVVTCALVASSCSDAADEARDPVADQLATPLIDEEPTPPASVTATPRTEADAATPGTRATPTPLATPTAGDDEPTSQPGPTEPSQAPTAPPATGEPSEPGTSTPSSDVPAPTAPPATEPTGSPAPSSGDGSTPDRPRAANLTVEVLERLGHDATAFTQGLEFHEGRLFESRGRYGASALTEIDPTTGAVLRRTDLGPDFFAEGLTVVGDRIIQLTWQEERAFVYDIDTFAVVDEFTYTGEGWGLCFDDAAGDGRLIMSNGTDVLTFRDPETFAATGSVPVTINGDPLVRLNELECVDGLVWANVWRTDSIVVIDPATGAVVSVIDASGLLTPAERASADVFNGIARDHDTGRWVVTGKDWPAMFVVDFVPV